MGIQTEADLIQLMSEVQDRLFQQKNEIDRLRGVLAEARSWVKEYSFQMQAYTIAEEAKSCVKRIDAALAEGNRQEGGV